jgi:thiol-disulfide isomerase/thioredoxin
LSLALAFASLPCSADTVLLDFSSATCGPCQQMRPVVHRLAAAGYRVREVSIEREPQLAARFGVTQVPTFVVLVDDREAARLTGTTSYAQLQEMMDRSASRSATRAPVVPLGQSPDTFAAPDRDLSVPQAGRIMEIADPNRPPRTAPREAVNPFGPASTGQPAPPAGSSLHDRRFLEATVKVAVLDPDGTSAGTGTMVDSRSGEALVLTCGHLFRTSGGKGPITVTLYQVGPAGVAVHTTVPGHLIDFDLDRDLALVSIRIEGPVQTVPIAPKGVMLVPGAAVTTVGCNNGANPTAVSSHITTVDRYQGHPNVQVAGQPVEGRSGGGLFNGQGQLVGVCNAADPQDSEGLYASLPSIHAKLDSLQLAMVYQTPGGVPQVAANTVAETAPVAAAPPAAAPLDVTLAQDAVTETPPPLPAPAPATATASSLRQTEGTSPGLSESEQAALDEIRRRGASSEVICIIRPHSPDGKSEVITLHNASPAFVEALSQGVAGASLR